MHALRTFATRSLTVGAWLACMLVSLPGADAAVNTSKETRTVQLKRGSTIVATTDTLQQCEAQAAALIAADAVTKTSGSSVYTCADTIRWAVSFKVGAPTCTAPRPAQQSRDLACPAGTTGTWHQTMDAVAMAYPTCWSVGEWTPAAPAPGICAVPAPAATLVYACSDAGADGRLVESASINWPNCAGAAYKDPSKALIVATNSGTPPLVWKLASKVTTEKVWAKTGEVGEWLAPSAITWAGVPNRAPTISGTPASSVQAGSSYSFRPTGSDVDGDTLTFEVANKPSWATFSTSTGQLAGVPTAANVGAYSNIVIAVSDGKAKTSLPSFSVAVNQVSMGAATLSWTAPTQNVDSTALTNLAGYLIYYGTSSSALTQSVQVSNPGVTTYLVESLAPATYYFAVRAYTTSGIESANSNIVSKTIP